MMTFSDLKVESATRSLNLSVAPMFRHNQKARHSVLHENLTTVHNKKARKYVKRMSAETIYYTAR